MTHADAAARAQELDREAEEAWYGLGRISYTGDRPEARHDVSVAAKTGTLAAEDQIALNDAARDLAALAEARSALGDGEQQ